MIKYEDEIEATKRKLKELEAKSLESKNHPIPENERFIAEYMHDKTCKSSHEDQCDWLYDKGDWSMHSRKHYLEKAKNALKLVDAKTIIAILKIAY